MRVLLIGKFHYKRGGSETYRFGLAEGLFAKGHEVIYFAMKDERNIPCKEEKYFVSNVDYNASNKSVIGKVREGLNVFYSREAKANMEALLKAEKPDIAHIGLIHRQITFSVVDALKNANIPVVMTMHDLIFACPNYIMLDSQGRLCDDCITRSVFSCVKKRCVKRSMAKSLLGVTENRYLKWKRHYDKIDMYIAETEAYQSMMIKSRFTRSPITTRLNPLAKSQVYSFNRNYEDYILFFGRFSRERNLLLLLRAHQLMGQKYRMILVGAGPLEEEMRNLISKEGLVNVELPGPIYGDELENILEKSRVLVFPSEWYENCPYAVMQAMAKGKVVVASRSGGLTQMIDDGKTGFLYERGNLDDLAAKLDNVMKMDKESYEVMSEHIVEDAKKKFYWENYMDWLLPEYERLLSEKHINQKSEVK